jgi:hypothetical protein
MRQLIELIAQQVGDTGTGWPAELVAESILRNEMQKVWPQINDQTKGVTVPCASSFDHGVIIPVGEDRATLDFVKFGFMWGIDNSMVIIRAAYMPQKDTLYIRESRKVGNA